MQNDRLAKYMEIQYVASALSQNPLLRDSGKNTVPLRPLRLFGHRFHISANGTYLWQLLWMVRITKTLCLTHDRFHQHDTMSR